IRTTSNCGRTFWVQPRWRSHACGKADRVTNFADGRHQTFANLDALWTSRNPHILPLSGTPRCEIRVDPEHNEIRLRTAYQAPEPDLARLRNLSFTAVVESGEELAEIVINVDSNLRTAYGLLAAIADALQIEGLAL